MKVPKQIEPILRVRYSSEYPVMTGVRPAKPCGCARNEDGTCDLIFDYCPHGTNAYCSINPPCECRCH